MSPTRWRITVPAWALALACAALVGPVDAQTAELEPFRDNTLYESPTGALSNGAGTAFFAGRTAQGSNSIRRGLVAFDVAAEVPADAIIVSVELQLFLSQAATVAPRVISLHRALEEWGEGTSFAPLGQGSGAPATPDDATWIHTMFDDEFWENTGGSYEASATQSATVTIPGLYTWSTSPEMVAEVQSWLDDPATNFGWVLEGDESAAGTAKRFETRESVNPAVRPKLTVVYETAGVPFDRGDCNTDGNFGLPDAIFGLNALFVAGSPQPSCADACDINDDGTFGLPDMIAMLSSLFVMGTPPAPPHMSCGTDPTTDGLDCAAFDPCP